MHACEERLCEDIWEGSHSQAQKRVLAETILDCTLILDVQTTDNKKVSFYLLYFVMAP